MRIRYVRAINTPLYARAAEGDVADVPEASAEAYIAAGYALEVGPDAELTEVDNADAESRPDS